MSASFQRFRTHFLHGRTGLRDLGRVWGHVLFYALASRVTLSLVLFPGLAIVLRWFLARGERAVLSDQEILFFFFSPAGLITLLIVGGFWVGLALLEQSGMMSIALGASHGRQVTWLNALQFVLRCLPRILLLGSHFLARAILLILPFAALAGGVFWLLLTDYDINFYLSNRPPEFFWASVLIGGIGIALAIMLSRKLCSWMYALPILLFESLPPRVAIRRSVERTQGRRMLLFGWVFAWLLGRTVLSAIVTWLTGIVGHLIVPITLASSGLTAFTLGGIGLVTIVLNFMISLLAASLFAMVVVRLYREDSADTVALSKLPTGLDACQKLNGGRATVLPPRRWIYFASGLTAAALLVAILVVSRIEIEDRAIVIAHRGASAAAPENTMAAFRQAMEDGADFVEIDVQETADGEVVVFHDSDFMKTARNPLKIWEATLADLADIDIGSWFREDFAAERVPTLEQVLQLCKGETRVNIELKYYGHDVDLEQRVIDIVERNNMSHEVVVMSLKYDKVAKFRKLRPDWTFGLLSSVSLGNRAAFDVEFLAINAANARRSFIRQTRGDGRDVYVWTVNDPLALSAMMSRGVDGIITDKPALARQVLEMRRGLSPIERLLLGIGTEVGRLGSSDESSTDDDA